MTRKTRSRREAGKYGEQIASHLLTKDGYHILCHNYTCQGGEVDIIVAKGEYLCFVEVKTRKLGSKDIPREAVDENKISHIRACIDCFMTEYGDNKYICALKPRIDVVEIYTDKNTFYSYNHITGITD